MKRIAAYLFALVVAAHTTASASAQPMPAGEGEMIVLPLASGTTPPPVMESYVPAEATMPPPGPVPIYGGHHHGPMYRQYRGVPTGGLEMGGGVYILKPRWNSNTAYAVTSTSGTTVSESFPEFSYNPELASTAWVGVTNQKGFGVRFRMLNYDQQAETLSTTVGSGAALTTADPLGVGPIMLGTSGDTATFQSDLAISAWDLEVAQQIGIGHLLGTISGGLRYSHSSQDYIVDSQQISGIRDVLDSGHNFNGIGPLVGLELRYPYEGRYGCFSLFGKGRGGLIFGDTKQNVSHQTFNAAGTLVSTGLANRSGEDVLPVTDIEFGFELGRNFHIAYFFFESSLFAQTWYGIGNASNTTGIGDGTQTDFGSGENLGLIGAKLAMGFRF